jgi:phytoene dehydrogenase-like protein
LTARAPAANFRPVRPGVATADVVIVGSALGGLVAGALLARHGRRVVVVEATDAVGGGSGAVARPDGYWLSFGHRDGHDVGDCQLPWHHGAAAAVAADVVVPLRRIAAPLRVHHAPDGAVVAARWGAAGFVGAARDLLGCPVDALDELGRVVRGLATAGEAEVRAAIPVTLAAWLPAHVASPAVRDAVLALVGVVFHPQPGEASVGRLMQHLRAPRDGPFLPDDPDAGGLQGVVAPWARAIEARGGTIATGWCPVEIAVADGRVRGVVAVDRTSQVLEVHAPAVVSTYPAWENLALLDARVLPADFVATALALRGHRADLIGWAAGLRRLPRVRATGLTDDHDGWNRILWGPDRRYGGGWQITSLGSPSAAPPGRHLLELVIARFFRGAETAGEPWPAARAIVDRAVAYLERFYADLPDCLAWAAHRWLPAPRSMSWAWAPVHRHGLTLDGLDGLYLVGATVEGPAAMVDLGAWAGRAAADAILGAPPVS